MRPSADSPSGHSNAVRTAFGSVTLLVALLLFAPGAAASARVHGPASRMTLCEAGLEPWVARTGWLGGATDPRSARLEAAPRMPRPACRGHAVGLGATSARVPESQDLPPPAA